MKEAKIIPGKRRVDFHTHPPRARHISKLYEKLGSPGVVGLSTINYPGYFKRSLTFEEVLKRFSPHIQELEKGKLAKLGEGYLIREQEFNGIDYHILGMAFEHDYLDNNLDPRKAVELIHKYNGMAQLNHPGIITSPSLYKKVNTSQEERKKKELVDMCDFVEEHNAQNINFWLASPLAFLLNKLYDKDIDVFMKSANNPAKQIVKESGKPGTYSSDARLLQHIKSNCVYIPDSGKDLSTEEVFSYIKQNQFEKSKPRLVSQASFGAGMVELTLREREFLLKAKGPYV